MNITAIDQKCVSSLERGTLSDYLSAAEHRRYKSIPESRRTDWLVGRISIKQSASDYLFHHNLSELEIENSPSGQPFIIGQNKLFCSLGHSYSWGIGAVSSQPIGVDIEKVRTHKNDLLEYIADKKEIETLQDQFTDVPNLITAIWTLKEAVLKGLGVGFEMPPKKLRIYSQRDGSYLIEVKRSSKVDEWKAFSYKVGNFFLSVASLNKSHERPQISWYKPVSI